MHDSRFLAHVFNFPEGLLPEALETGALAKRVANNSYCVIPWQKDPLGGVSHTPLGRLEQVGWQQQQQESPLVGTVEREWGRRLWPGSAAEPQTAAAAAPPTATAPAAPAAGTSSSESSSSNPRSSMQVANPKRAKTEPEEEETPLDNRDDNPKRNLTKANSFLQVSLFF